MAIVLPTQQNPWTSVINAFRRSAEQVLPMKLKQDYADRIRKEERERAERAASDARSQQWEMLRAKQDHAQRMARDKMILQQNMLKAKNLFSLIEKGYKPIDITSKQWTTQDMPAGSPVKQLPTEGVIGVYGRLLQKKEGYSDIRVDENGQTWGTNPYTKVYEKVIGAPKPGDLALTKINRNQATLDVLNKMVAEKKIDQATANLMYANTMGITPTAAQKNLSDINRERIKNDLKPYSLREWIKIDSAAKRAITTMTVTVGKQVPAAVAESDAATKKALGLIDDIETNMGIAMGIGKKDMRKWAGKWPSAVTGKFDWAKRIAQNWGLMKPDLSVDVRIDSAALRTTMYAMGGKQLSDREIDYVFRPMLPDASDIPAIYMIKMRRFRALFERTMATRLQAFKDWGFAVPSIEGEVTSDNRRNLQQVLIKSKSDKETRLLRHGFVMENARDADGVPIYPKEFIIRALMKTNEFKESGLTKDILEDYILEVEYRGKPYTTDPSREGSIQIPLRR